MLCEFKIINKNPKYRIIKYNDEYLIVDLVSSWIVFFLPMINWFIPKNYVKISKEEFDVLNIFKPVRNNAFWPVTGALVLLVTLSKNIFICSIPILDKNSNNHMFCHITMCNNMLFILEPKTKTTYLGQN